jgi:hypothetical protein
MMVVLGKNLLTCYTANIIFQTSTNFIIFIFITMLTILYLNFKKFTPKGLKKLYTFFYEVSIVKKDLDFCYNKFGKKILKEWDNYE